MTLRYAVTGATGFVGSRVCQMLIMQNKHVTAFARNISEIKYSTESRVLDLDKPLNINLENIDVLIHTAAYLPPSYDDSLEENKCNLYNGYATRDLVEASIIAGVKSFIYVSSGQVYSFGKIAKEDDEVKPMRAIYYLNSKLLGEKYVNNKQNLRTVILRPSSIYGPGMKPKGLVPRLCAKIMDKEIVTDKDVGEHRWIDLVYIDDVVWMILKTASDSNTFGIYNVGGDMVTGFGVAYRLGMLLKNIELIKATDQISLKHEHSLLNNSKAEKIGYKPRDIENGLSSYVESLR